MNALLRIAGHVAMLLLILPADVSFRYLSAATDRRPVTRLQIADGIYLFRSPNYGDVGLDGNSVAIVSTDGVLVFDTNGTPAAAESVLAEIRSITDRPVRYIVNSHWHWDHWYGTEVYQRAFPDVRIISHQKTREMMMGPALAFNKPGLETQLPEYIGHLQKRVAEAEAAGGSTPSPELLAQKRLLAEDQFFLDQKRGVHHTFPNVTYTDRLDLYLGDRLIQVRHVDRAVTPGDSFLFLPAEKVLITGDLLVNPVSFALSCYPSGWIRTLEYLQGLDASVIVPGHGEPLHDKRLLNDTLEVFRILMREGAAAKHRGIDVDDAKAEIVLKLNGAMQRIAKDDPAVIQAFQVQLVDWFLHRVYAEADGPLTDAIAPIPPR